MTEGEQEVSTQKLDRKQSHRRPKTERQAEGARERNRTAESTHEDTGRRADPRRRSHLTQTCAGQSSRCAEDLREKVTGRRPRPKSRLASQHLNNSPRLNSKSLRPPKRCIPHEQKTTTEETERPHKPEHIGERQPHRELAKKSILHSLSLIGAGVCQGVIRGVWEHCDPKRSEEWRLAKLGRAGPWTRTCLSLMASGSPSHPRDMKTLPWTIAGRMDAGQDARDGAPVQLGLLGRMAGARLDMRRMLHPCGTGLIRSSEVDWCAGRHARDTIPARDEAGTRTGLTRGDKCARILTRTGKGQDDTGCVRDEPDPWCTTREGVPARPDVLGERRGWTWVGRLRIIHPCVQEKGGQGLKLTRDGLLWIPHLRGLDKTMDEGFTWLDRTWGRPPGRGRGKKDQGWPRVGWTRVTA
ncbi:hypothetical protein Bca52824_017846 [Brassica carinata]|uniref:Uncharacterized protein n=1 Tax=Brassica carinata TaxID=52824 RepID=A0A8X8AVT4_BRACI|nr:hypothetical protein Bca52824_017846 [Brassica carinata]